MCILILKPKGVKLPDYMTFCRCARRNPHGFGFAVQGEKPFKSLDFDKFCEAIYSADEDRAMIIHFRLATHGSIRPGNCHPFRDNLNGLTFAHNGVMDIHPLPDRTDSETAFRLLFSPSADRFGFGSERFKRAVETIRGDSRLGFMNDDGDIIAFGRFYDSVGKIKNGIFKPVRQVYFSNQGYL